MKHRAKLVVIAVIKVNVRIIAATNRNLREEVQKGRFRQDLFYRLNVLPLEMPTLAERREDIPQLAAHFIKKYRHIRCAPYPEVSGISPEAHQLLAAHGWPGNVRELENAIEWAISMGATVYILPEDCRRRSDRLRMWRILAKVYMSGNLPRFRNHSSRDYSAKPGAIARKPPGGSSGCLLSSRLD